MQQNVFIDEKSQPVHWSFRLYQCNWCCKEGVIHTFRLNEHSTTYPNHWPSSITEGSTIDVSNEVYRDLKKKFQESIEKSVRIVSIKEICNHDYYDRYERFE